MAIHHPPPQNCYAGSSTSSWPSPVRGVRHGRDARYCALYSAHKGVPVRREVLVREPPVPQEWLHILNGKSYQIACHMLARYQIELAHSQTSRRDRAQRGHPLYSSPMGDLQIVDNTHKLQEHVP